MPLYVREGSIVPFGRDLQYSDQYPADTLTLYVYTGRDAEFTLYEDENTNYNYEKGAYLQIPLTYDEASGVLTIGAQEGAYEGMPTSRTVHVIVVLPSLRLPFRVNVFPTIRLSIPVKK